MLSKPWRYFFGILIVCFILGLVGTGVSAGSDRRIHPEWSATMFWLFGIGISFAYAALLAFVGVGCGRLVARNHSAWIKWLLRSVGIVPAILMGAILVVLKNGGNDPVGRLMSLLPFAQGILVVLSLGVLWLSCLGWKHHASPKLSGSNDGQ